MHRVGGLSAEESVTSETEGMTKETQRGRQMSIGHERQERALQEYSRDGQLEFRVQSLIKIIPSYHMQERHHHSSLA